MTELEKKQIKEIEELKNILIQNGLMQREKSKAFSSVDTKYLKRLGT